MPFNLGMGEVLVILIVALLVFGGRLPQVGRSLGRGILEFKEGLAGKRFLDEDDDDDEDDDEEEEEEDEEPDEDEEEPDEVEKPGQSDSVRPLGSNGNAAPDR